MGAVIPFPGVSIDRVNARPRSLSDLPDGAKAIVITKEPGGYQAALAPALTDQQRECRSTFPTAAQARSFARAKAAQYPDLYQIVLDHVRPTLGELLGCDPDGGHAA